MKHARDLSPKWTASGMMCLDDLVIQSSLTRLWTTTPSFSGLYVSLGRHVDLSRKVGLSEIHASWEYEHGINCKPIGSVVIIRARRYCSRKVRSNSRVFWHPTRDFSRFLAMRWTNRVCRSVCRASIFTSEEDAIGRFINWCNDTSKLYKALVSSTSLTPHWGPSFGNIYTPCSLQTIHI